MAKRRFLAWVPAHDETRDDAIDVDVDGWGGHEDAAREAAEHMWSHNDGWEWMGNGATIRVAPDDDDATEPQDFDISVEAEPVFYVRRLTAPDPDTGGG